MKLPLGKDSWGCSQMSGLILFRVCVNMDETAPMDFKEDNINTWDLNLKGLKEKGFWQWVYTHTLKFLKTPLLLFQFFPYYSSDT